MSLAKNRAILAGIALIPLLALNLSLASESRSIRFQHISQGQGLSQSYVYTIVQDQAGYMWFGTQEGLNRFDGIDFKVFAHDPEDPQSISDDTIRTMILDRSGLLWIGTDSGGLSRFDSASRTFTSYLHDPEDPTSISDNRVRVVYEDSAGDLWIGTDGSGLDRFDRESETFSHYANDPADPDSLASDNVWSILDDSDGLLWVATDSGLSRLDRRTKTFRHYKHDPGDPGSISDDQVRVLYADGENNLWIGTERGGLNRFDRENGLFERFVHDPNDASSISSNRVNAIYQDGSGVLWIGTVQGLNAWNPATRAFERYVNDQSDRYSLPHNNVLAIYQDRGDVLWIGTYGGLSRWTPATRAMLHYRNDADDPSSLSENAVTSFAEDTTGKIWIGTFGGGLNLLDRSTDRFQQLRHDPNDDNSLSSDRVMAVLVDSDGVLWAGTRAAGLNRYDMEAGSFTRYSHDPEEPTSISADGVTYILEDSDNDLWIGTFGGGLNKFDAETQQFTSFRHDPSDSLSLSSDRILLLFEDREGSIWIGTYGGGLNRFDRATNTFTRYPGEPAQRDGLSADVVTMIEEDPYGNLWIGTQGGGLNRWRAADRRAGNASFERFSELDGLPHATIYDGVWDQEHYLWLSTSLGLSRLDIETLEFKNYDTSHGLQADEFNLAAGYAAADGQLFFGGVNGFNAFRPDSLRGGRKPPQVVITSFLSMNKPVDLGQVASGDKGLQLRHDQYAIGFEFAGLDYAAPERNRYMYQLVGLDRDWMDSGFDRRASYTNLPPGEYTFRVKAANNDGVWSEQDAALTFRMLPAPWATWWAYLVYASIAVLLTLAAFRHHARRARETAMLEYAESLSLSHERLNEAQRIASIGNWDWNPATNELWWSDETYSLFGMDPGTQRATFDGFLQSVHPEDLEGVKEALERSLRDQQSFAIDHRIVRPDGTERIVDERAEVEFDDNGKPIRMAGTVHDITQRKQSEDEIRRRAKFQALLARLSSNLIMVPPDSFAEGIDRCLEIVGASYELDEISIWWRTKDRKAIESLNRWMGSGKESLPRRQALEGIPWIAERLMTSDASILVDSEQKPSNAASEREVLTQQAAQSTLIVPMLIEKSLKAICVFSTNREATAWSAGTREELKLVAEHLLGAISRSRAAAKIVELRQENLHLREHVRLNDNFEEIVGKDPALRACMAEVEKVAPTDVAVLILGETGTGKELFARAIHRLSDRSTRTMVRVNCPALPSELIESELFGHEQGAFTGAHSRRIGRFEIADGGTIFLDEIAELPLELQSKLLRVLQTGEFQRVGGTETLHCNVRVIAATNRDVHMMMERGELRPDLYYRIGSFPIRLPALRNRKNDIPLLAEHFVLKHANRLGKQINAISAAMIAELTRYAWPGNVRELESIIERALISADDSAVLEMPDSPHQIAAMQQPKAGNSFPDSISLDAVERSHILNILKQCGGRISGPGGAADLLDIPPSTLRSKMKRLGVSR